MAGSGRKKSELSKKKVKKVEDDLEEVSDEEVQEEEDEKKSKKSKNQKNKTKKVDDEDEELSDLEVEAEDAVVESTDQNDMITSNQSNFNNKFKTIDPKSRLCDLKADAILNYLVQLGNNDLNPQLKYGALNLLRQLTGTGKRRNHPQMYGNQPHGYNNHNYNQNQRPFDPQRNNAGRGRQMHHKQNMPKNPMNGDIYQD